MSIESLQVVYSHNLNESTGAPVKKLAELFPEPNYIEKLSYDIEKQLPADQVAELQKFLNKDELAKLKTSGFVVTDRVYKGGYEVLSFGEALYKIYSQDKNLFVSTDMILQAWHQSFDNVLIDLERYLLLNQLREILTSMAKVLPTYTKLNPSLDKSVFADLNLYLAVALHFLGETKSVSSLSYDKTLFKTLTEKIVQANSTDQIQLFGRLSTLDFSQFKPRGHYTRSALLSQYFQVISWLGKLDLPVTPAPDFNISEKQALYGLQLSVSLYELLVQSNMYDMWCCYDNAIRMLIGVSDNMTFRDLKTFATSKDLNKIQKDIMQTTVGIQAYGSNADMVLPGKNENELPRIFAFMGPRFAIDSWAMDRLIFKENRVQRRMTSAVDIAFTTLANDATVAEHIRRIEAPKTLRDGIEIQSRLISARKATDSLPASFWNSSIYNLWLNALRQLSIPTTGKNFPESMRTKSWATKELNTQLASWTTLRHDTIAYVKPARATFCGCDFPVGFVEPKVEFWKAMKEMTLAMSKFITETTFLDITVKVESQWSRDDKLDLKQFQTQLQGFYKRFEEILDVLTRLSEKEVNKVAFSAEENHWIRRAIEEKVGGSGFGSYTGWYYDMYYPHRYEALKADVIVADVFTNYPDMESGSPGSVLHEGIGEADILVLVAENVGAEPGKKPERVVRSGRMELGKAPSAIPNPSGELKGNEGSVDKTAVFYGPVYSYYEFETALNERLTDGEWGSLIDSPKIPERPSWTKEYLVHTYVEAKQTERW